MALRAVRSFATAGFAVRPWTTITASPPRSPLNTIRDFKWPLEYSGVLLRHFGPAETALEHSTSIPFRVRRLRDDELLVRVRATTVNNIDIQMRGGYASALFEHARPLPSVYLGRDFSGTVVASGSSLTIGDLIPGTDVFGSVPLLPARGGQSYGQYVVVKSFCVAPKPSDLTHEQAASVVSGVVTAWTALEQVIKLKPTQRILVVGGAGAVGSAAIYLARHHYGCNGIVTTCSPGDMPHVEQLGAHHAIDYSLLRRGAAGPDIAASLDPKSLNWCKNLDAVLIASRSPSSGGREFEEGYARMIRPGGVLAVLNSPHKNHLQSKHLGAALFKSFASVATDKFFFRTKYKIQYEYIISDPQLQPMRTFARLHKAYPFPTRIDSVYPLSEIVAAHKHFEFDRTKGKVVLTVD